MSGMRPVSDATRTAFTIIELLVVITIIGMLTAILLPAVNTVRESSRRASCLNNLKQVGVAISSYEVLRGSLPPGRIGCDSTGDTMKLPICPPGLSSDQKSGGSGFILMLPHLEAQAWYDDLAIEDGGLWNDNVNDLGWYYKDDGHYGESKKAEAIRIRPPVFACPSDSSAALSDVFAPVQAATGSYAFVNGSLGPDAAPHRAKFENNGPFIYKLPRAFAQIRDGLSQTFLVGEVVKADTWESSNIWTYTLVNADCLRSTRNPLNTRPGDGVNLNAQNGAFASQHPGGAQFVFADGHVKFLSDDVELSVYQSLSTINGKEVVQPLD